MFELGARWGANLFVAPLLAGVNPSGLSGPLSLLNALDATNAAQLHQLVFDISQRLSLPLQSPASYQRHVTHVQQLAEGPRKKEEAEGRQQGAGKETDVDKILTAMTPNRNWNRADLAKLANLSEGDALRALRALEGADRVTPLDVNEEPKGTFWRRL